MVEAPGVTRFRIRGDEIQVTLAIGIGDRTQIDENVASTIRHELTHAILQSALTDDVPPAWLHEAMATYFEPWDITRSDNERRFEREGRLFMRAARIQREQTVVDPSSAWMQSDTGRRLVYVYGQHLCIS